MPKIAQTKLWVFSFCRVCGGGGSEYFPQRFLLTLREGGWLKKKKTEVK